MFRSEYASVYIFVFTIVVTIFFLNLICAPPATYLSCFSKAAMFGFIPLSDGIWTFIDYWIPKIFFIEEQSWYYLTHC